MFVCDLRSITFTNSSRSHNVTAKQIVFESYMKLFTFLKYNIGLNNDNFYILFNGKKIDFSHEKCNMEGGILHIIPRTLGGKGGFGSMLRAIGAQIEKTTNREACRDLSGRRLRDINEEQRLKNWIAQQADREREADIRKKNKLERLCQEPKHEFKDDKYDECRSTMPEQMSNSIEQGFKASTSGTSTSTSQSSFKRKPDVKENKNKSKSKKRKMLIDNECSSSSDDSENEECTATSQITKSKI